jgi:hypothetical protein
MDEVLMLGSMPLFMVTKDKLLEVIEGHVLGEPEMVELRKLVLSHNVLSGEIPRFVRAPLVHLDPQSNRLSSSSEQRQ